MRRADFEHVIAAAAEIAREREIVVIGSQAIHGVAEEPPESMLVSMEVDLYPRSNPRKADDIEGSLGEGSQFQAMNGYYAQAVGPETAKAPAGWQERLVEVEIPPRVGQERGPVALCLDVHDLILAKCVAGRERDWKFARDALAEKLVRPDELLCRIDDLPIPPPDQAHVRKMLEGIVDKIGDLR